MALAVCLLLDGPADAAVRRLWDRLEAAGIGSLASHTHGRHVPHLTYASLLGTTPETTLDVLRGLPAQPPLTLHLDALGSFRRSRCWLAPAVTPELVARQAAVVEALLSRGAEVHRNYLPGRWIPHVTLAPRLRLSDLAAVAAVVYDVLPITAQLDRGALIDTSTGDREPLSGPL